VTVGDSTRAVCSVQGQRYDGAGLPVGTQFQVNTYTTSGQGEPAVAADGGGNFVVVWQSAQGDGSDTDKTSVHGQRYDATGSPLGGEFQVNSYTTSYQGAPDVAADASGNFVVVWDSSGSAGSDAYGSSIHGQRYNSAGRTRRGGISGEHLHHRTTVLSGGGH
jgi:hypothetical protein